MGGLTASARSEATGFGHAGRRGRPRRLGLAVLAVALVSFAFGGAQAAATETGLRFLRNATSSFDPILTGSTDAERQWMASHYWRMRGYDPYFASKDGLTWAPPTHFYNDLYAIHPNRTADQQLLAEHPDWVLRDSSGNRLYIQFSCNGTSCSQYAADVGSPQWRANWIARARASMDKGYAGIHVDDVNMLMRVSNGAGAFVRPVDPRTGALMTDADWRRYVAEFVAAIRSAFPAKEISHNPIWYVGHDDPYVQRQVDAADIIELERGFNDAGIVGGTGKFGYETYLAHIDWLHARGKRIVLEPYGLDATSREFEIASYFLSKAGSDMIASDFQANPDNWWLGWETDLGTPAGTRYLWNGLFRRDFGAGMVIVNQPGQPSKTVSLPSGSTWQDLGGNPVTTVTLDGRRGKVLRKGASAPPSTEPDDGGLEILGIKIRGKSASKRGGGKKGG